MIDIVKNQVFYTVSASMLWGGLPVVFIGAESKGAAFSCVKVEHGTCIVQRFKLEVPCTEV